MSDDQPLTVVKSEPLEETRPLTVVKSEPAHTKSWTDLVASFLPTMGGTVGSVTGGTLGAAIGGAAGEGYRQLYRQAGQLGPALADVSRNMITQPRATARGFLEGAGQGAMDAGLQAGIQGGANVVGHVLAAGAGRLAPALMQSAVKPGLKSTIAAVKSGAVPPVVKTLLDEGINVTPAGLEKLNGIIGASNDTVQEALASLPSSATISPLRVASRLNQTAARFANQVNPQADLEAISQVGQNFLEANQADLSPQAAQALKTGTYAALRSKSYGELKGAAIEAEKALARGLKEDVATEAAKAGIDLTSLNAREGAAIGASDAVAKRLAQVGNRDPGGLAWLVHSPVTFLLAVSARSSAAKSLLARGLYSAAAQASGMPAEALRWAVGAVSSGSQHNQETP